MDKKYIDTIEKEAISLAEAWQKRANELLKSEDIAILNQMARLLTNPLEKVILVKIIDQGFRSKKPRRVADQVNNLFRKYGIPDFFSTRERLLIRLFLIIGRHLPQLSVPKLIDNITKTCSRWVKFGEKDSLLIHLQKRKNQGKRVNINHLGEAVLGEEEALSRLNTYLKNLANPEIESVSVKISTIYSQIQSIAFEHTVNILTERLSKLYSAAMDNPFVRKDGGKVAKSVNLDMEEYKDLHITYSAFTKTLDQQKFKNYTGCIVLQSYLPDSFDIQQKLTSWAKKRVANGGNPVKIRVVKGANLEMEMVESSLKNWPLAPYDNKLDVDANFKRMVAFGIKPGNIEAVRLGIASHNLFELAYAYKLAMKNNVANHITFEMLEGMADHVQRAVFETVQDILLYTPVATREQFINAVAYLTRRLDENTGEENFLRYACNLTTESEEWRFLKNQFLASVNQIEKAGKTPHRIQSRTEETSLEKKGTYFENEFINEPDTDFSLAENRKWAKDIREKWKKSPEDKSLKIPLVIAGEEIYSNRDTTDCIDHCQYNNYKDSPVRTASFGKATDEDIDRAVAAAKDDPDKWREKSLKERHKILSRAAANLRLLRGDLIGAAAANTGKIFTESDVEVSEAVDFTEFYPYTVYRFEELKNIKCSGKGVGLVISPWNFPIAIPCGGIAVSLATGNTVILKPASAAVLAAWHLCRAFWEAGVSKNVLQFVPCTGNTTGKRLANHPDIDFIIFTGSTATGINILKQRPDLFFAAETGGKNATIVTSMSDRDQAIKNVIHSAFSNSGQKCSATSLLILEKEVYEDRAFKKHLIDAAKSYAVGSAWDFKNKMGPLIQPPEGVLKEALERLEPGESWALKPRYVHGNTRMLTPGIKWGVQPQSFTHMTEFFGPLIGVMRAENLDHAIKLVNQTGYGLTSGLESLDEREQNRWKDAIMAGNLYINRGTTGAIVLRQPFGGMGKSAIGAGIKAGGPNYVSQFMNYEETAFPYAGAIKKEHPLMQIAREWRLKINGNRFAEFKTNIKKTIRAIKSYLYNAEQEFSQEKDYFHLRGQDNIVRYLPAGKVLVRLHQNDTLFDVLARIAAVRISGCTLIISIPHRMNNKVTAFLSGTEGKRLVKETDIMRQSDKEVVRIMPEIQRIRYAAHDRVPRIIYEAAAKRGFYISRTKVMMEGRIELLQYYKEQSICINYHRYGNLGERAL